MEKGRNGMDSLDERFELEVKCLYNEEDGQDGVEERRRNVQRRYRKAQACQLCDCETPARAITPDGLERDALQHIDEKAAQSEALDLRLPLDNTVQNKRATDSHDRESGDVGDLSNGEVSGSLHLIVFGEGGNDSWVAEAEAIVERYEAKGTHENEGSDSDSDDIVVVSEPGHLQAHDHSEEHNGDVDGDERRHQGGESVAHRHDSGLVWVDSVADCSPRPEGKRVKRSSRSPFSWMIDVTGSGGGATRRNNPFLWATAEG
ncbi:unnamed protein product [Clonostachys byssicola]|uniref:Uncharacterized protein n=1 Tax=Clonostachys byssicola TaxID=160290 RepID=A0A9N9UD39_9HYPO|nr:unnamed protein product [Clonostachys byssicola]